MVLRMISLSEVINKRMIRNHQILSFSRKDTTEISLISCSDYEAKVVYSMFYLLILVTAPQKNLEKWLDILKKFSSKIGEYSLSKKFIKRIYDFIGQKDLQNLDNLS